jgi:transposase InsO family protein
MSDNGPAHVTKTFAKAYSSLRPRHIRTRLYTPRTNDKAERIIQALCNALGYGMPYQNCDERNG